MQILLSEIIQQRTSLKLKTTSRRTQIRKAFVEAETINGRLAVVLVAYDNHVKLLYLMTAFTISECAHATHMILANDTRCLPKYFRIWCQKIYHKLNENLPRKPSHVFTPILILKPLKIG